MNMWNLFENYTFFLRFITLRFRHGSITFQRTAVQAQAHTMLLCRVHIRNSVNI